MIQGINGSINAKKTKPIGPIKIVLKGIHHHDTPLTTMELIDIMRPKNPPIINKHFKGSQRNKYA